MIHLCISIRPPDSKVDPAGALRTDPGESEVNEIMHYETPEVFEIGAADELTLGSCGCCMDAESYMMCGDVQQLGP